MKTKQFFFLLIGFYQISLFAQEDIKESKIRIPAINLNIGFHMPGGDLADRFGSSTLFGMGFQLKNEENFYWGIDFAALAGVSKNVLASIEAGRHTARLEGFLRVTNALGLKLVLHE